MAKYTDTHEKFVSGSRSFNTGIKKNVRIKISVIDSLH